MMKPERFDHHTRQPAAACRGSQRNLVAAMATAFAALSLAGTLAQAQEERRTGAAAMLEEVVVSARKREESSQEVPLAVSAFSSDQLDAMKIRDLTNLSVGMPNVALDDVGTSRGIANFSIRGLGINSSIPTIDPTVGVFVNGVYIGVNNGILFDVFDLESVEVLRGPQGTLFGRNVTGGAVLMQTKRPTAEPEFAVRTAVDGGPEGDGLNKYAMGTVSGSLADGLAGRLTGYWNDDDGWFKNSFDDEDFGKVETWSVRPSLEYAVTERLNVLLRYEHMETEGDGPAGQCHTNGKGVDCRYDTFDRDSFDFAINDEGYQDTEVDFLSAQLDWDVNFGEGTVTNIFGWRDYDSEARVDVDSSVQNVFHAPSWLVAEQFSNELRYTGTFYDNTTVTTGVYYYNNDLTYHERRELLGVLNNSAAFAELDGGGYYKVESWSAFAAVDYDITPVWTLNAGFNYSTEDKEADVVSLVFNRDTGCNVVLYDNCNIDFRDDESWNSFAPKLGATYHLSETARLYGHWSRGFRSGGYNLRNTSPDPADVPGPFDEEQVDNFELGLKAEIGRGRINAAVFYNEVQDMQRELNLPSKGAGVIQLIRNTADAELLGIEVDGVYALLDNLTLVANVGWLDAEYSDVVYDISGDGVINSIDEGLDLPRAAEWTWSLGLNHDLALGEWGYMTSRISYAYRDESYFTDNNQGIIDEQEILDAGIDFNTNDGHWVFGIYGRNLLNEVKQGGDTQFDGIGPLPYGGTFAPLAKGMQVGVEVTYRM